MAASPSNEPPANTAVNALIIASEREPSAAGSAEANVTAAPGHSMAAHESRDGMDISE